MAEKIEAVYSLEKAELIVGKSGRCCTRIPILTDRV